MVGQGVDSGESIELCRRCGSVVYGFSKKRAASNGNVYCVKCAEVVDREYLIQNTCSVCSISLGKSDVKFVMPSKLYSQEPVPLIKRLICAKCYKRFARKSRARRFVNIKQIRESLKRSFVPGFIKN